MSGKQTSRSKHIDFIVLDLLCVEAAFFTAYAIRFKLNFSHMPAMYNWLNIILLFAHLAIVFISEGYSGIIRRGYLKELRRVLIHNCELFAIVLAIMFINKDSGNYSRIFIGTFFICDIVFMYAVRCCRKKILRSHKNDPRGKSCMMLVAEYEDIAQLVHVFASMPYKSYILEGAASLDTNSIGEKIEDVPIVADKESMYEYAKSHVVDDILIVYSGRKLPDIIRRFTAMGITVHVGVNALLPHMENLVVENIGNYTVLTTSTSVMSFKQKIVKRTFDIVASIIGLVFTFLLFIIFAPIIRIQSPGPIFFKQTRVGKNGRYFKLYKFRSMYKDAEERKKELQADNKMQGNMFKMEDDPRVTPIGRFMRRFSIDEFPQFLNVLKGDMSLVGTRPPTVEEYEKYAEHHKSRLAMKPGITGMWQVSGRSEITDFEEVVKLDNEYIVNFSINMDIKILFRTVKAVFSGKGSI